ncbi:phosphatase PAP2 family protein [Knoellia aerolata]|uniref:Phosphoesterase n=1 Tax=Knoellia aerolata DSM 18566 TaxID=1385519 RepID=A0A0A0JT50_9MICO|nr:phosphatase PAP2 family protein [Knoellia aerolata]KGN39864.1 phosphoesterase [Knoellia aerolata DSM 18566]
MPSADPQPPAPHDEERVGARDLADWRSALGRLLVRLVAPTARLVAGVLRWSVSNVALLLTAGVGLALVWGFTAATAEVYEDVVDRDGIAAVDQPVLDAAVAARTPFRSELATHFTDLGGPVVMPVVAVVVAVGLALLWRRWTPVVLMAIAGLGSLAMTVSGKQLTARLRPPESLAVPPFETSPSFPSGHTLNATVILGLTAYLLVLWINRRRVRALVIVVLGVLVVGMGLSRVFLGHHWLTDVVAGWAVGLAWLAVVITGHRVRITLDRHRRDDGQGRVPDTTSISQGPTKPSGPSN